MKTLVIAGLVCWLGMAGTAEAGIGDWVKNGWSYATAPVNCVVELGKDLLSAGVKFVTCVAQNINRNPATLSPLITLP